MRRVLVSGGSRGIGAEIVKSFALIGDKVVFIYNNADESAKTLCEATGASCIKADLSITENVNKAYKEAIDILGGIDILVTNAGIAQISQICDTTDDDLLKILNVNLASAFILCREASVDMVKNHSGRIITIGSVWGKYGASCEVAYSASKAGIRGMTMALSKELAPSGITVNCVEPGMIDTEMNSCFDEETKKSICEDIPMGYIGKTCDVSNLVLFLASEKASYITGQCIGVDGGFGN